MVAAIPVLLARRESPRIVHDEGNGGFSAISGWCRRPLLLSGLRRGRDRRVRAVPCLWRPLRLLGSRRSTAAHHDRPRQCHPADPDRHDQRQNRRPALAAADLRHHRPRRHAGHAALRRQLAPDGGFAVRLGRRGGSATPSAWPISGRSFQEGATSLRPTRPSFSATDSA